MYSVTLSDHMNEYSDKGFFIPGDISGELYQRRRFQRVELCHKHHTLLPFSL